MNKFRCKSFTVEIFFVINVLSMLTLIALQPATSQNVVPANGDSFGLPDIPSWKKLILKNEDREMVRYDNSVKRGILTLRYTHFLTTKSVPFISRHNFDIDVPSENKTLKATLGAVSEKMFSFSTKATSFQGATAYLTQFSVLRNKQIDQEKTLIWYKNGERYELDLIALQTNSQTPTDLINNEQAKSAWQTVINGLNKITTAHSAGATKISDKTIDKIKK